MPLDYGFPFRAEELKALETAVKVNPRDARAHYLMGNLLFDAQPEAATALWEKARRLDAGLSLVQTWMSDSQEEAIYLCSNSSVDNHA